MKRSALMLVAAASLSACYTYTSVELGDIAPQEDVRVRLAAAEADRLDDLVHSEGRVLDGEVVAAEGDSLLLLVPTHTELRGARVETLHQRVHVAREGVLIVERRDLDRPRTYLVTGAAAAAVVFVAMKTIFGEGGSERIDTAPVPNDTRIPGGIRLPFRLLELIGR